MNKQNTNSTETNVTEVGGKWIHIDITIMESKNKGEGYVDVRFEPKNRWSKMLMILSLMFFNRITVCDNKIELEKDNKLNGGGK